MGLDLGAVGHRVLHGRGVCIILFGVNAPLFVQGEPDFRIVIQIQALFRHIEEGRHLAVADAGGPPLIVQVQGRVRRAHHRELRDGKAVQNILGVLPGDLQGASQGVIAHNVSVRQTLSRLFRHTSAGQGHGIDRHRELVDLIDRVVRLLLVMEQHVEADAALGFGHAVHFRNRGHVLGLKAQGGQELIVEKGMLIQKHLGCFDHGRLGHLQPREEAGAQGNDAQDGQVPPQAAPDLPDKVFSCRPTHYHSISWMGMGLGLVSMETTVPFFTWITRSAMAVRAELWVIMMTVMFCFRQVSCRRAKMAFPVL